MRTNNINVLSFFAALTLVASTAFGAATIDFESLGSELDEVTSLMVTDPVTGNSATVEFYIFNSTGISGRPILVEEGLQGGLQAGFFPQDTPAGEVPGNGNDWMLGNGIGIPDNYMFVFTGREVANISLELIDFNSDGPLSTGTPGSDTATLRTFNSGGQDPVFAPSIYTTANPPGVDAPVATLASTASGVTEARLVFSPDGVDAGVAIDNLTFTILPEPGAGSLLGMALVFFGLIRRK